jgi:hypothetical protein
MKRVQLQFAVLDGSNPKTWPSYGKEFHAFMAAACVLAKPTAKVVSQRLLDKYYVEIMPAWTAPTDLPDEINTEGMVGVIIDAFPKPDTERDRDAKIEQLRGLVALLLDKRDGKAPFERFGYSIWLLTDETADVASFRDSVVDAAGAIIGINNVDVQVLNQESLLALHLSIYMQNVYIRLERP